MTGSGLLGGLTPAARWAVVGIAALLVALLGAAGGRGFLQYREASARRAFTDAVATYHQAMATTDAAQLTEAGKTLKQFLSDHPRSVHAAAAWYSLGNVEYRRGAPDAALAAFLEAARRDTQSIGALSRLGAGYAWEAKQEPARALDAYQEALKGRGPQDFLYVELLLGVARAQEQLQQPAAAVETYRRLLKDAPDSPRASEARARLALLGATAA